MHAARGVLTIRGGMTSHAAVIARGLGLPCVVGASDLRLDLDGRHADQRPTAACSARARSITLDGTRGAGDGRRAGDDPARARRRLLRAARLGRRRARPRGARQRRHPGRGAHGARLPRRRPRALPHRAHVLRRGAHHGDARDDPRRHRRRAAGGARPAAADAARRLRRALRDHARPAGDDPPARPAAARVPAARATRRSAALAEAMGLPVAQVTARARGARRGQPDARHARRAARRHHARDLRDAGPRDLRGGDRGQPRRAARRWCPR